MRWFLRMYIGPASVVRGLIENDVFITNLYYDLVQSLRIGDVELLVL